VMGGIPAGRAAGSRRAQRWPARKALGRALQGESPEELDLLTGEDERRAEEGLVEVLRESERLFKHIDELTPEDILGRIKAESARISWTKAGQERR
jgi:hypothetical protein